MRIGIALGSNVGDRLRNLQLARAEVLAAPGVSGETLCSKVYETEPVDCDPGTASYLNAVIEIGYEGHPIYLLE